MKNQGFTLIELLVVIAISTLLATVILPVVAKARATARHAKERADEQSKLEKWQALDSTRDEWEENASTLTGSNWLKEVLPQVRINSSEGVEIKITSISSSTSTRIHVNPGNKSPTTTINPENRGFIGCSGTGTVVVDSPDLPGVGKTRMVWWKSSLSEGRELKVGQIVKIYPTGVASGIFFASPLGQTSAK